MLDSRQWEPALGQATHARPIHPLPLTASSQRPQPVAEHVVSERAEFTSVARNTIVPVVPQQHGAQPFSHFGDGVMHSLAELFFDLLQLALHLLPHRLPKHGELPFSRFPADVRESEKIEGAMGVGPK